MSRLGLLTSSLLAVLGPPAVAAGPDASVPPERPAPLRLHASASATQVLLGEPFAVEAVITHRPEQRYELPTPAQTGDFDVLGTRRSRVDGAETSTTTYTVSLAAFRLGPQQTPALTVEISDPYGPGSLEIAGVDIEVIGSLAPDAGADGENLYDVRPPEEVLVRTWRLLYALAGLVGLTGLALLLYRWLTRPRTAAPAPPQPLEPLQVRTTRALDALARENLPARGAVGEFYFRLSEILRGHLGELYRFDALESTTPELLEALRTRPTPGLPMADVTHFAQESDWVRYAKVEIGPDGCKAALELGYHIVRATTPNPPAGSAQPPAPPPHAAPPHGPQRLP